MSNQKPLRVVRWFRAIGCCVAVGGICVVALLIWASFSLYPTIRTQFPNAPVINDVIRTIDPSTSPPTITDLRVGMIPCRSYSLEDGMLHYMTRDFATVMIYLDDTDVAFVNFPFQDIEFSRHARFGSGAPKSFDDYLTMHNGEMSSNQGSYPYYRFPIWWFSLPFIIGLGLLIIASRFRWRSETDRTQVKISSTATA